ncbi:MAG: hypothetical protein WAS72_01540, partial [Saprospiraceae bacterium]
MIAVVDSGSTKSDWVFLSPEGKEISTNTMGFNPFFHNEAKIASEVISNPVIQQYAKTVKDVYFYGAGCSDAMRSKIVERGLSHVFENANIVAEHDLLGAARALCGNQAGIACIIGTGSNSCLYDGEKIIDNITNLGFLLGDEGSGSYLGKMLVQGYFYREMPSDLVRLFEEKYPEGKRTIINKIYTEGANVYLAAFSNFYAQHPTHPYLQQLITKGFIDFLTRHVVKYENYKMYPVSFVGSVAFYYQDILKDCLEKLNLQFGNIIQKPIQKLVSYHVSSNEIKQSANQ